MPISKKILTEIDKLKIDNGEKDLLKKILIKEESGLKHYKKEYDKIISDYLKETEGEE